MSVFLIINCIIVIACSIGVPLNGIVIWLLEFRIKRNPFTVLILNLAIADFGFLAIWEIVSICYLIKNIHSIRLGIPFTILIYLSDYFYVNGLFLLTAISIDRCVAVLFPIWHRCSRPKHLSPVVCAIIWICASLFVGILNIMEFVFNYYDFANLYLVATAALCLPSIIISTLILFVKICLKPKQIKRGRLLVIILITLLCFLIFNLPLNILGLCALYSHMSFSFQGSDLYKFIIVGGSLNSTVNPIIYYLVGRKKRAQTRESIKVIFQRAFKEDEALENRETATDRVSTPL